MLKSLRSAPLAGAALLLSACQGDGPPEAAMEKAWLAWAGRADVRGFEKVSCKKAAETRWRCTFKTRHRMRRGGHRLTLTANRSGVFQQHAGRWTYLGKLTGEANN